MLSEETAVGEYPADTVRTMSEVAEAAEAWPHVRTTPQGAAAAVDDDRVAWAVAHASVQAAEDLGVAAIVCPTQSGTTARRVAAFRPAVPIAGISDQPESPRAAVPRVGCATARRDVRRRPTIRSCATRSKAARDCGIARKGDLIAIVSASPGNARARPTPSASCAPDNAAPLRQAGVTEDRRR